jgi:hypothetical protein
MCEFIPVCRYNPPNITGPIDSILRAPDDSKYYLSPVYDFVASIVHDRVG